MCEDCQTCERCDTHIAMMEELTEGKRAWTNDDVLAMVGYFEHLFDDLADAVRENMTALLPDLAQETANTLKDLASGMLSHGLMLYVAGQHARVHISRSN